MQGPPRILMVDPPLPGMMPVGVVLEWGQPWEEAICQWCQSPQWWDLLPVPWWCLLVQEWLGQTDKDRGEASSQQSTSLVLLHQIMVLWLWAFFNSMKKDVLLPFATTKKVVLEGRSGIFKTAIFVCTVKCENKIVNSFSLKKKKSKQTCQSIRYCNFTFWATF